MRRFYPILLLALFILYSNCVALASSIQEANSVLERGEYQQYVATLEELSNQGHAEALDDLGELYLLGRIVERDQKKARNLFELAANAGSLDGLCHLGRCYEEGLGGAKYSQKAIELYEAADRKGCPRAPLFLAELYRSKKDYAKAIELMNRSIELGLNDAKYVLSTMYFDGLGVAKDEKKAHDLCVEAAEAGSTQAMGELARDYKFGIKGQPINLRLAKLWAKKGVSKGNGHCQTVLADIYLGENDTPGNIEQALNLYQQAVEQRVRWALVDLGLIYETGKYVKKDVKKARELYQLASDRDYTYGQLNLANVLLTGSDGSKPDPKAAFALFLKAAQQGNESAQYQVGRAFQYGEGVAVNSKLARTWFEAAIKQGNPHACNQLSLMFLNGTADGIAKDEKEAMRLRTQGAKLGCPFAQGALGWNYECGTRCKKDFKQALYWYKKSEEQNRYDWVAYHLAELYERGNLVPGNIPLAIRYYKRAAALGYKGSEEKASALQRKHLTPAISKSIQRSLTSH